MFTRTKYYIYLLAASMFFGHSIVVLFFLHIFFFCHAPVDSSTSSYAGLVIPIRRNTK